MNASLRLSSLFAFALLRCSQPGPTPCNSICAGDETCVAEVCQRMPAADAGVADAAIVDAGVVDSGAIDAGVDAGVVDAGQSDFNRLVTWLVGDFDNRAQAPTVGKLVERHVCPMPGRPATDTSRWFYVENVEHLDGGLRDSYYTRVVELTATATGAVSRTNRFLAGHPLASSAFSYNGPKDGCSRTSELMAVTNASLEYRQGCDVTFVADGGASFSANTSGTACLFPGGYIQVTATLSANAISTQDIAFQGNIPTGERFDFVRVTDFKAPDSGT
jgi:hypothetical protein